MGCMPAQTNTATSDDLARRFAAVSPGVRENDNEATVMHAFKSGWNSRDEEVAELRKSIREAVSNRSIHLDAENKRLEAKVKVFTLENAKLREALDKLWHMGITENQREVIEAALSLKDTKA